MSRRPHRFSPPIRQRPARERSFAVEILVVLLALAAVEAGLLALSSWLASGESEVHHGR